MSSSDLAWQLESWLQSRYGAKVVLNSRPSTGPAGVSLHNQREFAWREILTSTSPAPHIAGMRLMPDNPTRYELVEWFGGYDYQRSYWRPDHFSDWQRVIDV